MRLLLRGWGFERVALLGVVGSWCGCGRADGCVFGGGADGDGVGEREADDGLGGDLDLLAAGDGVGSGADSSAGCCSDGCAFAAAEDASEDGAYGCSAAYFFGGVLAAAFALFGVGFGGDGMCSPLWLMVVSEMVRSELPL